MGPINKIHIKDILKNIIMGFIKNVKKKCYLYFS